MEVSLTFCDLQRLQLLLGELPLLERRRQQLRQDLQEGRVQRRRRHRGGGRVRH